MADTLEVKQTLVQDTLAKEIANFWQQWNNARMPWLGQKREMREFLFSTNTKSTAVGALPWKNSTVTPKLTQLRDNLHANYMAALFPSEDWLSWEGEDQDAVSKRKRRIIEAYMRNKCKASDFEIVVSQLVNDYIDYGNVFGGHEYVSDMKTDPDGNKQVIYMGPRAFRVSPLDVVFDPTSATFDKTPFIHRVVKTIGDLERDMQEKPGLGYDRAKIQEAKKYRKNYVDYSDMIKNSGWIVDGFPTLQTYFQSNKIEILHFWGDIYDLDKDVLHKDMIISVIDRMHVLRMIPNPSWLGTRPYKHCGWRLRPDNLWAQGPLDQLVGMQYRIDHLENLKADVFDLIAHPVILIKGDTVEDFKFGPGVKVDCGDEGDVEFKSPEAGALNADMQIENLMNKMEELAGAPKQAMGIRTPGEKTKYEVQVLENGAGRIFQSKVNWFEKNIIEPLLNSMLEDARRHLTEKDQVKIVDPDTGAVEFLTITKEDITAKGRMYPMGARHFAAQAKFAQDLTTTMQLVQKMPTVAPHISGKAVAFALEHVLGWEAYGMVKPNIAIAEQMETKKLMNSAEQSIQQDNATPSNIQPGDIPPNEQPPTQTPPQGPGRPGAQPPNRGRQVP